ncbi:MAG: Rossmann-like domain-containing protein [Syntrophobacteraceae bacterium]
MGLVENLYDCFYKKALQTKVSHLCVGLRYTAVVTDTDATGIAFTYTGGGGCCPKPDDYRDYEGESAAELLEAIKSPSPLARSMALALINALNHERANGLAGDSSDISWMDSLGIGAGSKVAMVGLFSPLLKILKARGAQVEVLERNGNHGEGGDLGFGRILHGGQEALFYEKLTDWAQTLILTSTSILNGTTEEVLSHIGPEVKVIMLGPSTPMVSEAFSRLPVRILAGTVAVDAEAVLRAVRHGAGTPVIHRFSRKVLMNLDTPTAGLSAKLSQS